MPSRQPRLQIGFLLQRAHRGLRTAHNEALRPLGLTIAHAAVLGLIGERGGLSQTELFETIGADKSTMVNLVDDLERYGLAERRADPADRRAHAVHLTEAGRQRLAIAGPLMKRVESAFLSPLSRSQRAQLQRLLGPLAETPEPDRRGQRSRPGEREASRPRPSPPRSSAGFGRRLPGRRRR